MFCVFKRNSLLEQNKIKPNLIGQKAMLHNLIKVITTCKGAPTISPDNVYISLAVLSSFSLCFLFGSSWGRQLSCIDTLRVVLALIHLWIGKMLQIVSSILQGLLAEDEVEVISVVLLVSPILSIKLLK